MKKTKFVISISLLLVLITGLPFISYAQNNCTKQPGFLQQLQFDLTRSGFSTADRMHTGIVFAEFKDPRNPAEYTKFYQHPSWKKAGSLGSIIFDEEGNVYVAPLPVINTLNNQVNQKNSIFKIDHATGVMDSLCSLPIESKRYSENPFGIVGMAYDCNDHSLYVSTLEGSTPKEEKGKIYRIDLTTFHIDLELSNVDALGLAVSDMNSERKLFFGSARNGDIYSVKISGVPTGSAIKTKEFSLNGLGSRGDDKARKLKFSNNNTVIVYGVEFDYNLIAPTNRQESVYEFQFDPNSRKWVLSRQQ